MSIIRCPYDSCSDGKSLRLESKWECDPKFHFFFYWVFVSFTHSFESIVKHFGIRYSVFGIRNAYFRVILIKYMRRIHSPPTTNDKRQFTTNSDPMRKVNMEKEVKYTLWASKTKIGSTMIAYMSVVLAQMPFYIYKQLNNHNSCINWLKQIYLRSQGLTVSSHTGSSNILFTMNKR